MATINELTALGFKNNFADYRLELPAGTTEADANLMINGGLTKNNGIMDGWSNKGVKTISDSGKQYIVIPADQVAAIDGSELQLFEDKLVKAQIQAAANLWNDVKSAEMANWSSEQVRMFDIDRDGKVTGTDLAQVGIDTNALSLFINNNLVDAEGKVKTMSDRQIDAARDLWKNTTYGEMANWSSEQVKTFDVVVDGKVTLADIEALKLKKPAEQEYQHFIDKNLISKDGTIKTDAERAADKAAAETKRQQEDFLKERGAAKVDGNKAKLDELEDKLGYPQFSTPEFKTKIAEQDKQFEQFKKEDNLLKKRAEALLSGDKNAQIEIDDTIFNSNVFASAQFKAKVAEQDKQFGTLQKELKNRESVLGTTDTETKIMAETAISNLTLFDGKAALQKQDMQQAVAATKSLFGVVKAVGASIGDKISEIKTPIPEISPDRLQSLVAGGALADHEEKGLAAERKNLLDKRGTALVDSDKKTLQTIQHQLDNQNKFHTPEFQATIKEQDTQFEQLKEMLAQRVVQKGRAAKGEDSDYDLDNRIKQEIKLLPAEKAIANQDAQIEQDAQKAAQAEKAVADAKAAKEAVGQKKLQGAAEALTALDKTKGEIADSYGGYEIGKDKVLSSYDMSKIEVPTFETTSTFYNKRMEENRNLASTLDLNSDGIADAAEIGMAAKQAGIKVDANALAKKLDVGNVNPRSTSGQSRSSSTENYI